MIHYRSPLEIELIRKSALLVGDALAEAAKMLKAGVTTMQVDTRMEQFIRDNGAVPSFKNYQGTYPFATCISVNDAVVHGFPTNNVLKDGDIVSVDVGVFMNGYHGDSAYTFIIGSTSEEVKKLLRVTKESLYKGIEKAIVNNSSDRLDNENKIRVLTFFTGINIQENYTIQYTDKLFDAGIIKVSKKHKQQSV